MNATSQPITKILTGRWKLVKTEFPHNVTFNLDDLTTSYKAFFTRQKQGLYKGHVTTNDSLYIQVLFEKAVNDFNKMFIEFKGDHHYLTNSYDKDGNLTDITESGKFYYDQSKNTIITYPDDKRKKRGSIQLIFVNRSKLVIQFSNASIFRCRKDINRPL